MALVIFTTTLLPKQTLAILKFALSISAIGRMIIWAATVVNVLVQVVALLVILVNVITVVPTFGIEAVGIVKLPIPAAIVTTTVWPANMLLPFKS